MIQRVQTIWMVATAGLVGAGGVVGASGGGGHLGWSMAMAGAAALVPLVALFLFNNRQRQVSMLIAEFVLLVGAAGFAVYGAWVAHTAWSYAPVFVFAAFVTDWLALRGVLKDMMLLRNADRLR